MLATSAPPSHPHMVPSSATVVAPAVVSQAPPPAYTTAQMLPIVRVPSVLGAQTAPNTVLGMERGAVKLITLSPAAEAKVIEVRFVPLIDNKPAPNPATQTDLPKLAADNAPLMVFFPGSKLYLGSAAGKKLMFSMRAVPLQAWKVQPRSDKPGTYMLVSHAKPEFALGLEGDKVATVPSDSAQNVLLLTVDAIQPPAPAADATGAAPGKPGTAAAAGAAARPAGPAARKAPAQVMETKAAAAAVSESKLDASILDGIRNKGNHGLEIAVPVALQYKDRLQYLTAASLANPNSTELMFAKLDPVRDGGNIAYFELLTLVAEADDPSKISLKHFDGKAKRDQAAVIFDSRTQTFLAARPDGTFYARDDVASEDVLWQIVKDPSAQLAVSIVHFRNQKRLVAEHQKPGSGVLAKRSPIVLRCKGNPRAATSEEDCVFTLCPEKTAQTDLGFQAKGHETRLEKIRTIATIVSPFAMAASATVGVASVGMGMMSKASSADPQPQQSQGGEPVAAASMAAQAPPAPVHAGENGAQQAGGRNDADGPPEIKDINGDGRIDSRDLTEEQFNQFQAQFNTSNRDDDRDNDRETGGRDSGRDANDNDRDDDRTGSRRNEDDQDDDDDLDALDVDGLDLDAGDQDRFPGGSPAPDVNSAFTRESQQQSPSGNNRDGDRDDEEASNNRLDAFEASREQDSRDARDGPQGNDSANNDWNGQLDADADADADVGGLDDVDVGDEIGAGGRGEDGFDMEFCGE